VPSTSKKQAKFMAAAAHNPEFAKKAGISQDVAKEFNQADKGKKFGSGRADLQKINRAKTRHGQQSIFKEGGIMKHSDIAKDKPMMKAEAEKAVKGHEKRMHKMAKGGVTRADGCVTKGHTKGKMISMKSGGTC
jgi:hypothetical protein